MLNTNSCWQGTYHAKYRLYMYMYFSFISTATDDEDMHLIQVIKLVSQSMWLSLGGDHGSAVHQ
jgi:hypothetical protein